MGIVRNNGNEIATQVNGRWKPVGTVDPITRVMKVYRQRENHLLRVWNAYGFSMAVLENGGEWFDDILIREEYKDGIYIRKNYYLVPRNDILIHGREYKADGYEKQMFISLEQLQQYKQNVNVK